VLFRPRNQRPDSRRDCDLPVTARAIHKWMVFETKDLIHEGIATFFLILFQLPTL